MIDINLPSFRNPLTLYDYLMQGYALTVVFLLIVRLVKRKVDLDLFETANWLVLAIVLMRIGGSVWQLVVSYQSGYFYEQVAFYRRVLGKYFWSYWLFFGIKLLPLLFLFKRIRRGWVLPLILVPIAYFEVYAMITTFFTREFLQMSGSYILELFIITQLQNFAAFAVLLVIAVFAKWVIAQVIMRARRAIPSAK